MAPMTRIVRAVKVMEERGQADSPCRKVLFLCETLLAFRESPQGTVRRAITDEEVVALGALFFLGMNESERFRCSTRDAMEEAGRLADALRDTIEYETKEEW